MSGKVSLLDTVNMLEKFQNVMRRVPIKSLNRDENDGEHSYSLTFMAWKIITNDKLPLNLDLAIKYALAHDLVEVYAGDVLTFDDDGRANKVENERKALERLKQDQTLNNITDTIEKYEKKADEESLFIYGLDKLLPPVMYVASNIAVYQEFNISFDDWQKKIKPMTEKSIYLAPYYEQVLSLLKQNKHLFSEEK
ncbi:MAG: HD domain-containing protein [Candidatus Nomurabacteria bacterium]|jgi:putative hydrolase of HD superfamily|nr:HD domain-containing protein [Candidatus Nomurabacteria bacterium]